MGEYGEVKEFLTKLKFEKYLDNFITNGIEDLETITELTEEHLNQIGIPMGHNLKMMKAIKELSKKRDL